MLFYRVLFYHHFFFLINKLWIFLLFSFECPKTQFLCHPTKPNIADKYSQFFNNTPQPLPPIISLNILRLSLINNFKCKFRISTVVKSVYLKPDVPHDFHYFFSFFPDVVLIEGLPPFLCKKLRPRTTSDREESWGTCVIHQHFTLPQSRM